MKEERDKRDVLGYGCLSWVTLVRRLEEKEIVENRLTLLLKHFLGTMDQSGSAYDMLNYTNSDMLHIGIGTPYNMVKQYDCRFKRFPSGYSLPIFMDFTRLSSCTRASFATVTFGFHKDHTGVVDSRSFKYQPRTLMANLYCSSRLWETQFLSLRIY